MAKGNIMTGTLRGKIGDIIFSRQGGEQRSRAYIPEVKNPKTRSQMVQRAQLSNLVSFYRNIIRLFPSAFQNKPSNQSDYNQFVSKNLNAVKVYLTREEANAGACVCAPYQLTHGSLSPIQTYGEGVGARTNIYLGNNFEITNSTTVGQISAAIINNNDGWVEGMQLAYISAIQSTNATTGHPMVQGYLYSFTLNLADTTPVRELIPEFGLSVVSGYIGHGASAGSGGFAWIKSSIGPNGNILVSSQRLVLTDNDLFGVYSGAAQRGNAIASYGAQDDVFLNPRSNNLTSTDSQDIEGGVASVSSVSVAGNIINTTGTAVIAIAANDSVRIVGTQLADKELKLALSDTNSQSVLALSDAQAIESVLSDVDQANTLVTGKFTAAHANTRRMALYADGELVWHTEHYLEEQGGNSEGGIG